VTHLTVTHLTVTHLTVTHLTVTHLTLGVPFWDRDSNSGPLIDAA
jgi:hypothetical protein